MSIERSDWNSGSTSLLDMHERLMSELGDDPGAQAALLLLESAQDSRANAREERETEESQLRQLENEQVQKMHEQADAVRDAAWAKGLGAFLEGGCSVVGGVAEIQCFQRGESALGQAASTTCVGTGKTWSSLGNLLGGVYDHEAKVCEADATRAGNLANQSKRQLDDLKQAEDGAQQLARQAIQLASDNAKSKSAMEAATVYLRG